MAITNETDLSAALSELQSPLSLTYCDFSTIMKSEEMNLNSDTIYNALNDLYERVRLLEDIHDYCYDYMNRTIADKKEKLLQTLKEIERNVDRNMKTTDAGTPLSLSWSEDAVYTRDGKTAAPMSSHTFQPEGRISNTVNVSAITHTCVDIPYTFTRDGNTLHAVYRKDSAVPVYDSVTVLWDKAAEINYIDFSCSNANIIVSGIKDNDEEIELPVNCYFQPVILKGLVLDINCSNMSIVSQDYAVQGHQFMDNLSSLSNLSNVITEKDAESRLSDNNAVIREKKNERNLNAFTKAWEKLGNG